MRALAVAAALICLPVSAIAADPKAAPLDAVYACAGLGDDAARLACYDAAVGRLKSAQEAGDVVAVDRESIKELEKESFGFSLPSLPKLALPKLGGGRSERSAAADSGLEKIQAGLVRIEKAGPTRNRLYLDNGQVWLQIDGSPARARGKGPHTVEIRRAALGSFLMTINDTGASIRVRREQ